MGGCVDVKVCVRMGVRMGVGGCEGGWFNRIKK